MSLQSLRETLTEIGSKEDPDLEVHRIKDEKPHMYSWKKSIGSEDFEFEAFERHGGGWEVNFSRSKASGSAAWKKSEKPDQGMAVQVMSAAMGFFRKFLSMEKPDKVHFSAQKEAGDNRASLYTRMAKSIQGYNVRVSNDESETHFDLVRK